MSVSSVYSPVCHSQIQLPLAPSGRIAVIGAGGFGRFCIDAYREASDFDVVAVADPDPSALARVQGPVGRFSMDWEEVVHDDAVEVVHIATPPHLRLRIMAAAFAARKSVFCEKPLALTLEEADALIAGARHAGVILGIDYVMRHLGAYRGLEALVTSGLLGKLRTISFQNFAQIVPADHWFWDRRRSGGILVEHGVHFFDAYSRIAGPPEEVRGYALRREAVDAGVRYRGGAIGRFYHEFAFPYEIERTTGIAGFERGYIEIEGWIPTRLHGSALAPREAIENILPGATQREEVTSFDVVFPDRDQQYRQAICAGMRDVVHAHRDPAHRLTVSPADARESLRLALEAQAAIDSGCPRRVAYD